MLKRTLIALEVSYLGTLLLIALFTYAFSGGESELPIRTLISSQLFIALGIQLVLLPAAYIIARYTARHEHPRFLKLLTLQWLLIFPTGSLLFYAATTLLGGSASDGSLSLAATPLIIPLLLIMLTPVCLPAMLVSTFFIHRASRPL